MADTNIKKESDGYGYKYTDLAQIHTYLEEHDTRYYQYIERIEGDDYIFTVPIVDGEELPPRRGCRVVQASLSGKSNPAQEQGSALTYARRYSLLMAFGLATTDDDAQLLTVTDKEEIARNAAEELAQLRAKVMKYVVDGNFSKESIEKICKKYGVTELKDMSANSCKDYLRQIEMVKKKKEAEENGK